MKSSDAFADDMRDASVVVGAGDEMARGLRVPRDDIGQHQLQREADVRRRVDIRNRGRNKVHLFSPGIKKPGHPSGMARLVSAMKLDQESQVERHPCE
jgi:hypothetical protein